MKKWLQDDLPALRLRRRVEALAEEWQRSRDATNPQGDEGLLLTRAQIAALDGWLQQGDVALPKCESVFVEASREQRNSDEQREIERLRRLADAETEKTRQAEARQLAEQQQRESETRRANDAVKHARFAKRLTAVIAVVALLAIGLGIYANQKRTEADTNAVAANTQTKVANTESENARKAEKDTRHTRFVQIMRSANLAWQRHDTQFVQKLLNSAADLEDAPRIKRSIDWFYHWRVSHSEITSLPRLSGPVLSVAFSTDGKKLLASNGNGHKKDSLRLFDLESLKYQGVALGANAQWASFSPDGKQVIAIADGRVAHFSTTAHFSPI